MDSSAIGGISGAMSGCRRPHIASLHRRYVHGNRFLERRSKYSPQRCATMDRQAILSSRRRPEPTSGVDAGLRRYDKMGETAFWPLPPVGMAREARHLDTQRIDRGVRGEEYRLHVGA